MKVISKPRALALAILSLAGSAYAQSSVTMFGLIDANVGRYKGANVGVTPTDTPIARQEAGGLSTSHIGFRGTEDLGGGLAASFELAAFLRTDSGAVGRSDAICAGGPTCSAVNVTADPFFARASWVGLGSKGMGRVRLGQVTTGLFINSTSTNAFADSTNFSPLNMLLFVGSPLAGGTGWSNSIAYDSPNFSGVTFNLQKSLAEGSNGGNWGGSAAYRSGPFSVTAAHTDVKKDPVSFSDGTSKNNTKNSLLGLTYDLNVVKLFGHLGRIKSDGSGTARVDDANITHKIWELSALVPVGAGRVMAGFGTRKGNEAFASKRTLASVGYAYSFSKRTDAYVLVRNDKMRAQGAVAAATEASGYGYAVGLRHSF